MYCTECGAQYNQGERFCAACGATMEAPAPEPPAADETNGEYGEADRAAYGEGAYGVRKGRRSLAKLLIGLGGAAVLVLLAVILTNVIRGGGRFGTYSDDALLFVHMDDGALQVLSDGQAVATLDGIGSISYSMDRSVLTVIDEDNTLYTLTKSGASRVADDVKAAAISQDGSHVAFLSDYDKDTYTGTLYLHTVGGESEKIADDVIVEPVVLSPNGQSVAYETLIDDQEMDGYIYTKGGELEKLGRNCMVLALADKSRYIYYLKVDFDAGSCSFYVDKGGEQVKLASDIYDLGGCFNRDLSEVLYRHDDKIYISRAGGDKERVAGDAYGCYLAIPRNGARYSSYNEFSVFAVYDVDTLAGSVFSNGDSFYYLGKDLESEKIIADGYGATVSEDGKSLLYYSSNRIYRIEDLTRDATKEAIASGIGSYYLVSASSDLSVLAYVDKDEAIYYKKGDNDPVRIGYDGESLLLTESGKVLYYISDGILYVSKNGAKGSSVSGGQNVVSILQSGDSVYYTCDSESYADCYDLYYAALGDTAFTLVAKGVQYAYTY